MVGESNQNVFMIQIDASRFSEFEISKFEISRFDCSFILAGRKLAHSGYQRQMALKTAAIVTQISNICIISAF